MHTQSSYFFFLKAKALNTAILFTDLHLQQKMKTRTTTKKQKQNNTLKKLQTS